MPIRLTYGWRQQFRCRNPGSTVLGRVLRAACTGKAAEVASNASAQGNLYVEQEDDRNIDGRHG